MASNPSIADAEVMVRAPRPTIWLAIGTYQGRMGRLPKSDGTTEHGGLLQVIGLIQ